MDPLNLKPRVGPEKLIQRAMNKELRNRGWYVKDTHGNEFTSGWPDTYACHARYGPRWIEYKSGRSGCRLEESQQEVFQKFGERRVGVWILTGDSEAEYLKLFRPCNWYLFLDVMKVVSRPRERRRPPKRAKQRISSSGPEREIQEAIKAELRREGWFCLDTHGNIHSYGFPDFYACHRDYGARWVEVKRPVGYRFTPAQLETFPQFCAHGSGVWVLDGTGQVDRLFKRPNWYSYLEVMK